MTPAKQADTVNLKDGVPSVRGGRGAVLRASPEGPRLTVTSFGTLEFHLMPFEGSAWYLTVGPVDC